MGLFVYIKINGRHEVEIGFTSIKSSNTAYSQRVYEQDDCNDLAIASATKLPKGKGTLQLSMAQVHCNYGKVS